MHESDAQYPDITAPADNWAAWSVARLAFYEGASPSDPLTNSVRRHAHEVFEGIRKGQIDLATIGRITKTISDKALYERADAFASAHQGSISQDQSVETMLAGLEGTSFEKAKTALEYARGGIVFTAHPTFAMSAALREAFTDYIVAGGNKGKDQIARLPHAPDRDITLSDEHVAVQKAIRHAKGSLQIILTSMLSWARQQYPDQWTDIIPQPVTVASWVGYDLDGRTDIHWGESFRLRLEEKAVQIDQYIAALQAIDLGTQNKQRDALISRLEGAATFTKEQVELFSKDLNEPENVTRAANKLTEPDERRLISLAEVRRAIDNLIDLPLDDDTKLSLCVLRSEIQTYGLGASRIHLRINAAQVRSALRADLGIDDVRGFIDRMTLATAAEKARSVAQRKISLASIFLEQMTARRQLMLCAEFVKHIDSDTPIRFLIAECEAPATVMGAVYLARLYGIDHLLDISPLFETPEAIEAGGRFLERLLDEEEYVNYIRARGRISIQIGFSDSGRFMGQVAANLAIERLQILLSRALHQRRIQDVDVLIFNTHGESMGRGGYPGNLHERFDYLMTPWTRARYEHDGLKTIVECSFQGGDGFLHFQNEVLAQSTVNAFIQWCFDTPTADHEDLYYKDINLSWDYYRAIKSWQEDMFEDPDYQLVIGAFASNMLFTTGSRKVRRQSGTNVIGPRALRAIPHNAILQQLAVPMNIFGGIGHAAGQEIDRLTDHITGSGRMQQILGIAGNARRLASLPALRAYAYPFTASLWVGKSAREPDLAAAAAFEEIASTLRDSGVAMSIHRFADNLSTDLRKFDMATERIEGALTDVDRRAARLPLHALHAMRQALIMQGLFLTASLPGFSQRHDLSRKSLLEMAFALRYEELADLLERVFPAEDSDAALLKGVKEESDDWTDRPRGYPEIHADIIDPLRRLHQMIREIGVGISHAYGAYG